MSAFLPAPRQLINEPLRNPDGGYTDFPHHSMTWQSVRKYTVHMYSSGRYGYMCTGCQRKWLSWYLSVHSPLVSRTYPLPMYKHTLCRHHRILVRICLLLL